MRTSYDVWMTDRRPFDSIDPELLEKVMMGELALEAIYPELVKPVFTFSTQGRFALMWGSGSTIEQLEGGGWGDPRGYGLPLEIECWEVSTKPLEDFTPRDIDLLVGQGIGLRYLIPMAVVLLEEHALLMAWAYPGDLLTTVLGVCSEFWDANPDLRIDIENIVADLESNVADLRDTIALFRSQKRFD